MDGILDQLNQVIETRIAQIKDEMEGKNPTECLKETKEEVEHMDRILRMLPRDEMEWLNDRLMEQRAACKRPPVLVIYQKIGGL